MTPQEKASEIILRFQDTRMDIMTTQDSCPCIFSDYPTHRTAKICATIAVDELIKLFEFSFPSRGFKISYWDEVKQEINKL